MSDLAQDVRVGWPVWRLAWVIVFGAFASGLDTSLVNVGLHTIAADLHAGLPVVQWVATGYVLALAVSLPLAGWLGRRIGVGRLWLVSLAAFTVASAGCAAASSIAALIGLRVVQGLAGGLLIPAGQTVLGQAVGAQRLGRVMATLGSAVATAPALGPVVGGVLLNAASWPWLFAINLPIGALGLLLGMRYVPRGEPQQIGRPDGRSLAYVSGALPLIVYGLSQAAERHDFALPLAIGAAALAGFIVRSRRIRHPLLHLGMFCDRVFRAAVVATGLTGMAMFGSGLLFPLYFQLGHGYGVMATGIHLLCLGGATAVALPITGRLVDRTGAGIVSMVGCAVVTVAVIPFAVLPIEANAVLIHLLLVLLGAGVALAAVPPGIAAYKRVSPERLADATAVVSIVQRVGGALGGALFTLILAGSGFHAACWAMATVGVAGFGATAWLTANSRR